MFRKGEKIMEKKEKDLIKKVLIKLKSVQLSEGDRSEIELVTEGLYKKVNGGFEVGYDETEATGFEGSHTTISCIGENYASLIREGKLCSKLVIEKDKKHHAYYDTPYGGFMVGIYADKINNKLDDGGGELYFKYTVDVNSSLVSENEVFISVTERNKQ